jgi:hypothetical protein
LLLQDPSGIYVLSREPLKVLGYIEAPQSYPAKFSGDSQSIIVVSLALIYWRWAVRDGQGLDNKELPIPDGCVDAELSPDGELLACYRPDFSLGVLKISTGKWIFADVIHPTNPHSTVVPIPLGSDTPFAAPFGFTLAHDMKPIANRTNIGLPMRFSPDGSMLIAGDVRDAVRVDLVGRKKTNLPGAVQKNLSGSVTMQDDIHALVISSGRPGEPALRSLKNGDILASPNFKADSADLATDTRYALLYDSGKPGARVFDLEDNRQIETPENIGVDVRGGELALAADNGELFLYRLREHEPFASVHLPLEGMPFLRTASVTPALDKLAIAVNGAGALYQIASGQRIMSSQQFTSINFAGPATAFFLMSERRSGPSPALDYFIDRVDAHGETYAASKDRDAILVTGSQTMLQLDINAGKSSAVWTGTRDLLRPGGPVLFEYSFESSGAGGILLPQANDAASASNMMGAGGVHMAGTLILRQVVELPFFLRALDPMTGEQLWSRSFSGLPPIPFADPQDDRLVLSWQAKSAEASAAARHSAVAKDALKRAKLTDNDTFLEALDARTGKSVGGVLVQGGTGPVNFDSIFSAGDVIIFSKDAVRVYIYSLLDGQLKAKLIGVRPSANAQNNLLALETGSGLLTIYDLYTGAKLDEQFFSDPIAYTHFSENGQRLFVLTENQDAFVIDMTRIRAAH